MSTPERTDDPGEHGYGAAKQQPDAGLVVTAEEDDGRSEAEANPSRRGRERPGSADETYDP